MLSTGFYDDDDIQLHNHAKPFKAKLSGECFKKLSMYTKANNQKYVYGNDDDFMWEVNKSYRSNSGYASFENMLTQWDMLTKGFHEGRKLRLFRLTNSVLHILFETYWDQPDDYCIECLDLRGTQIIDIKQLLLKDISKTYLFDGAQVLANWIISSGMCWSLKHILVSTELKASLKKYLKDANLHQIVVSDTINPLEELYYLRISTKTDMDYHKALAIISEAKKHKRSRVTFDNLYLKHPELSKLLQKCSGVEQIVFNGCHFKFNFQVPSNSWLKTTKSIRLHCSLVEYSDNEEPQSTESGVDKITSDRAKFAEYLKLFGYKSA